MAFLPMLTLFLSTILSSPLNLAWQVEPPAPAGAVSQQPAPLDTVVIEFGEQKVSVRSVVKRLNPDQDQLLRLLESDAAYRRAYLSSPRFLASTRAYADLMRLDELGVRKVDQEALLAEAAAFAKDRQSRLSPEAMLRSRPLLIELRARLFTQQAGAFSTQELRLHMLRSVPEFFGEMQISWIRIPLVDAEQARALTEAETRKVYDRLDEAAQALQTQEISWKKAVEKYSEDAASKPRDGAMGVVTRTATDRFEEPMLRAIFADLGFKKPSGKLLRGPIVAEKWAYLIRIDGMRIDGVPELQRARPQIQRSLRETLLQEQLAGIRKVLPATVHAPLILAAE
jgi:PPIC-type PPIASE domain